MVNCSEELLNYLWNFLSFDRLQANVHANEFWKIIFFILIEGEIDLKKTSSKSQLH